MDSQSIRVKQYKKFYNVLAYKFKKHTKIEIGFLVNEILMKKQSEQYKVQLLPNLIFEIYSIIDMKDTQPDPFWQLVDYFSDFIKVVATGHNQKSIFQKITKNKIEIYHKFSTPECQLSLGLNKKSILKGGAVCLCSKDIRKKYQCYKCEVECHKSCLSWTQGDLICPNCMLYYYDPFMRVQQVIVKAQILEDRFVYKFNIDQSMVRENHYLVIKCIKIDSKVNQKYNECQINFPQKAMVKLNQKTIQTYKPEKNDYIRKRDKPIAINLMQNFNDYLKKGLNIFYCEYDLEREENENIEYVFSISICKYRDVEDVISDKVSEQSSLPNKLQNSKNYIRESFRSAMDPLKIKMALSDPITTKQIKIPVRGDNCKHLTVFCLETYLKNLKSTDFKKMECPQCKKLILDFKIDFYLVEILFEFQSLITNKNLEQEITMFQDLSYKFHEAPPINSQEFLSISNRNSPDAKNQTPKAKKRQQNNLSQNTEEDPDDENFEIFSSSQQKQSQPQSSFFVKRGRGRPPGSKNKTPEERFKNKMQEILKQANKMYSFNIAQQNTPVLSDEERKIVDAMKKCTHSESVPDSILLESYYDTVQLQKKVKSYLTYEDQYLQEEYCQIIQFKINQIQKKYLKKIPSISISIKNITKESNVYLITFRPLFFLFIQYFTNKGYKKLLARVHIQIFFNTFFIIKSGHNKYNKNSIVIGIIVYSKFCFLVLTFFKFLKPIRKNVEKHIIRNAWKRNKNDQLAKLKSIDCFQPSIRYINNPIKIISIAISQKAIFIFFPNLIVQLIYKSFLIIKILDQMKFKLKTWVFYTRENKFGIFKIFIFFGYFGPHNKYKNESKNKYI